MLRRFFVLTSVLSLLMCFKVYSLEIKAISDVYAPFSKFGSAAELVDFLKGDTIRFVDFNEENVTIFKNIKPDTIWLKERPKKKPQEGKHYRLRYLYHSDIIEENNISTEVTPIREFVGTSFVINNYVVKNLNSFHYIDVYITNILTGECLIWEIISNDFSTVKYKVESNRLEHELSLLNQVVYSARNFSHGDTPIYSDIEAYHCVGVKSYYLFNNMSSKLKVELSLVDENNVSKQVEIPLQVNKKEYLSTIWFDASQLACVEESSKVYEIDYTINMDVLKSTSLTGFNVLIGYTSQSDFVSQKLEPTNPLKGGSSSGYLSSDEMIYIGDKLSVRGVDYYKGVLNGKAFYIPTSNVSISEDTQMKIDSLVSCSQEVRDSFFCLTKAISYANYMKKMNDALDEIKEQGIKGLSIPYWSVYDMSEYTDGTGVEFSFYNPTKKTIKYINLSFVGYNAVDDKVGGVKEKRCIGPIAPEETASYDFEYVWFTDIVEYAKLLSISVQYMDGTVKTISKPESIVWKKEIKDLFDNEILENIKYKVVGI